MGVRDVLVGVKKRDVKGHDVSPLWLSEVLAFFVDTPAKVWLALHYSFCNFSHMAKDDWHHAFWRLLGEKAPAALPCVACL